MRMHGTSAQVQSASQPDHPDKYLSIDRVPGGTQISGNFPARMSVHMAIPTPLSAERTESILGFATPRTQVFKDTSVSVLRIQVYVKGSASLGTFVAMDGNRKIFQDNMDDLYVLIPTNDEYYEGEPLSSVKTYTCDLSQRVHTGLGVTFDLGLTGFDDQSVLVVGAKAIYRSRA